jgi:predicted nucleotidyltransferase
MSTLAEMLRCAERELKFRKSVFSRRVERGKMSVVQADYEIKTMEAIADHFREIVARSQPQLFNPDTTGVSNHDKPTDEG